MRVIYTSLDEYDLDSGRTVRTIWGHDMSLQNVAGELERLQDKIDAYIAQLNTRMDSTSRRRLRAKLEALEREHDFLFRQANPPSTNAEEYVESGILNCAARDCTNQLTRELAFQTTPGFCPPCWRKATKSTTERTTY